jgi:hypothetical protein
LKASTNLNQRYHFDPPPPEMAVQQRRHYVSEELSDISKNRSSNRELKLMK